MDIPVHLTNEYLGLQDIVEGFNSQILTIKGWSVTVCVVGLGTAFLKRNFAVALLAGFAAVMFWTLEVLWKLFAKAHIVRLEKIEAAVEQGKVAALLPLQITASWEEAWDKTGVLDFLCIAIKTSTLIPHGVSVFVVFSLLVVTPWRRYLFGHPPGHI